MKNVKNKLNVVELSTIEKLKIKGGSAESQEVIINADLTEV